MSSTLSFANATFGIASFSNISVTETDVGTVGSFTASPMAFAAQNVPIVGVSAYQGLEWQGFQAGAYAPGSSTTLNFSFDVASTDPTQGLGQMFAAFQPDAQAGSGISINLVEKVYNSSGQLVGEENLNLGDTTGTPGSQPGDLPMFAAYQNLHVDVSVTASVAANAPPGSLDDFSIIDFGFKPTPLAQTASIGDNVFMDTAGTGIQTGVNAGPGVAGVTVNLLSANGSTVLATTTTDANGNYNFANLLPGTYEVQFVSPTGYAFSPENASSNPDLASSANPTTGITAPITVTAGQHVVSVDAGLVPTGTIGNTVYLDTTDSGVPTGIGVPGVTVELLNSTGTTVLATTTTNAQGQYEFTHLPPGTYEVQFVPPAGYVIAPANTSVTVLDAPNPTTGITNPLALTGGQNITNADCGLYQPASIGNTVFLDKADTGALTSTGIAGVTVKLLNAAGTTVLATTTTDANGHYTFANLVPGTYEVQFVEPSGYTFSPEGGSSASVANPTTGLTTQITLTSGENLTTVDAGLVPPAPPPPPVAPQIVVDKIPGSMVINANGTETYTIDVTNTGTTAITKLSLVDNIGTSGKPVDITPTAVTKNGYNVGDTNHDGILNAGETWQYTVTTTVSGSGGVTCPNTGSSGSGSNCGGGSQGGSSWGGGSYGSNCYGGSRGGSESNQGGYGSNCYSGGSSYGSGSNGYGGSSGSWGGSGDQGGSYGSNCYGGSSGGSWGGSDSNQGGYGSNCYSGGSSYGSGSNCYGGSSGSWGGSGDQGGSYGSNCYGGSSGGSWGGSESNQGGYGSNCYSGGSDYGSGSNCYGGGSSYGSGGSWGSDGGSSYGGGSNCYSGGSDYGSGSNCYGGGSSYGSGGSWGSDGGSSYGGGSNCYGGGSGDGSGSNCYGGGSSGSGSNCGSGSTTTGYGSTSVADTVTATGTTATGATVTASDSADIVVLGSQPQSGYGCGGSSNSQTITVGGTAPTGSLSSLYGTAEKIEFIYNPGKTVSVGSGGSASVTGSNTLSQAFVLITNNANAHAAGATIYEEGTVSAGAKIYADATINELTNTPVAAPNNTMSTASGANLYAFIYSSQAAYQAGAAALETATYSTSSSHAMHIGDTIGSLSVAGYVGTNGGHLVS